MGSVATGGGVDKGRHIVMATATVRLRRSPQRLTETPCFGVITLAIGVTVAGRTGTVCGTTGREGSPLTHVGGAGGNSTVGELQINGTVDVCGGSNSTAGITIAMAGTTRKPVRVRVLDVVSGSRGTGHVAVASTATQGGIAPIRSFI